MPLLLINQDSGVKIGLVPTNYPFTYVACEKLKFYVLMMTVATFPSSYDEPLLVRISKVLRSLS